MQADAKASAALWAPDNSGLLSVLPDRYPQVATQYQKSATTQLFRWYQESSLPTEHRSQVFPTVPDRQRAFAPLSKSTNARFHTEERKAITCYPKGTPETLFSQGTQKPSTSHCPSLQESRISPSKSWNHSSSTNWQSGTLLLLAGLPPTMLRDPAFPTATAGEPLCPHQRAGTPAPLLRG
jgi:hypothetical protein